MKKFLFCILAATAFCSANAFATSPADAICWSTITSDSGHTSRHANDNSFRCSCEFYSCHFNYVAAGSYCGPNYTNVGTTVLGKACCHDYTTACPAPQAEPTLESSTTVTSNENSNGLEEAFSNDGSRTGDVYYGMMDNINKSPSSGRGNSVAAKLDACLSYTNVNVYTVGNLSSWNACRADCDSSKNGYCDNSGSNDGTTETAYACKDRCDCYIGGFAGHACEGF